jgi:uncharacterized protein (AIM24 family)
MSAHEIDYQIFGEEMQYVSVELDPQETAIAEPGAFMMMEDGINLLLPKSDDAWVNFLNPFLRLTRKEKNKKLIKIKNND